MKKYCIAFAAVAIVAIMCIPASVISDDADAVTITAADKAASFEGNNISQENLEKLIGTDGTTDIAEDILSKFVLSPSAFTVSEVKFSDVNIRKANGESLSETKRIVVNDDTLTAKVTFKATCTVNGSALFKSIVLNRDLINYIGSDYNVTQVDAVLEVSATVRYVEAREITSTLVKTSEDNYVITGEESSSMDTTVFDADFTYTYKVDAQPVTKTFTMSYETVEGGSGSMKLILEGGVEPADVTAATKVTQEYRYDDLIYIISKNTVKADGKTSTYSEDLSGYVAASVKDQEMQQSLDAPISTFEGGRYFITADMSVVDRHFYGIGGLFTSVSDTELQDETKLKEFLGSIGTVSTEFSAAKKMTESDANNGSSGNILLYAGIGIAAVVIIAGAFFIFRKKSA